MVEFVALVTVVGCLLCAVIAPGSWRGVAAVAGLVGGPEVRERILLFEVRCRLAFLRDLASAIGDVERYAEELEQRRAARRRPKS